VGWPTRFEDAVRVVAIVQGRMGSTRLPGKVLKELAGRPMIEHVLERAAAIEGVDQVVLATSDRAMDDPLVDQVERQGLAGVFRGSEDDVLARYLGAAVAAGADAVVRVTADCPLLSPSVSARVVRALLESDAPCDYVSNTLTRSYPRGLDTEAFSFAALAEAEAEATDPWDREHVTPFIWRQPKRFRLREVCDDDSDRSAHRWTVDTPEDFELISRIYSELWRPSRPLFEYDEVIRCLDAHPDWVELNRHVQQKSAPQ